MEDKIKRLMDHANIDEKTAREALEKNENNVLKAFTYLNEDKEVKEEKEKKETKKEKKYVDYNSNQRYMNTNPQKETKNAKKEVSPVIKPIKVEKTKSAETKNSYEAPQAPKVNLKHEDFNIGSYNTNYSNKGSYDTQQNYSNNIDVEKYKEYTDSNFKGIMKQILGWIVGLFEYLVKTKLVIMRRNNVIISIPLIISLIILAFTFWAALPLFIVSLFFGFRYFIESENEVSDNVEDHVKNNYWYEKAPRRKAPFPPNNNNFNPYPPRGNGPRPPYNNYPHQKNQPQRNNNVQYNNANENKPYYNPADVEKQRYEKTNKKYFEELEKFQGIKNIILTQEETKVPEAKNENINNENINNENTNVENQKNNDNLD